MGRVKYNNTKEPKKVHMTVGLCSNPEKAKKQNKGDREPRNQTYNGRNKPNKEEEEEETKRALN